MLRRQPQARLLPLLNFLEFDSHHTPQQTRHKSIDEMKTVTAERLCAAKALAWRGRGELAHGAHPVRDFLLVVLCTSLTGLLAALLAVTVRCVALSVQQNPHHAKAILHCFS